jgi:hypothetical protein
MDERTESWEEDDNVEESGLSISDKTGGCNFVRTAEEEGGTSLLNEFCGFNGGAGEDVKTGVIASTMSEVVVALFSATEGGSEVAGDDEAGEVVCELDDWSTTAFSTASVVVAAEVPDDDEGVGDGGVIEAGAGVDIEIGGGSDTC